MFFKKLYVNFLQEGSHLWHIKMDLAVILYHKWETHKLELCNKILILLAKLCVKTCLFAFLHLCHVFFSFQFTIRGGKAFWRRNSLSIFRISNFSELQERISVFVID